MIKFLIAIIIILFSILVRGENLMDLRKIQHNEKYQFYMNVNEIYKNDYFVLNLIKFINLNIQILSLEKSIDELNKEKNIIFEFHLSKITSKPILMGTMDYVIIISYPSDEKKGKYLDEKE